MRDKENFINQREDKVRREVGRGRILEGRAPAYGLLRMGTLGGNRKSGSDRKQDPGRQTSGKMVWY